LNLKSLHLKSPPPILLLALSPQFNQHPSQDFIDSHAAPLAQSRHLIHRDALKQISLEWFSGFHQDLIDCET
jgi:hypothetical protein